MDHIFTGRAFPDSKWNDFIVVVLTWWVKAAKQLESCFSNDVEFLFMDGLFKLNCSKTSKHDPLVKLELIRFNSNSEHIIKESYVNQEQFIQAVIDASIKVREECIKLGYSEDIMELSKILKEWNR